MNKYNFCKRSSYNIFPLYLTSSSKDKCLKEAKLKLKSVYPGVLENKKIIVKKNDNFKKQWLCFVFEDEVRDNMVLPTLAALYYKKNYTGKVCLIASEYVEIVTIENGIFISSEIKEYNNYLKEDHYLEIKVEDIKRVNPDCYIAQSYKKIKTTLVYGAIILIILIAILFIISRMVNQRKTERYIEEMNIKKIELEKQTIESQKKTLIELEKQYNQLIEKKPLDSYFVLSILYSCFDDKSFIDDLTIFDNTFQISMHTKDSLKVLSNFENNRYISSISMSKVTQEKSFEYINISGAIHKIILYADNDFSDEEKIVYYNSEITKYEELKAKAENVLVSDYLSMIQKNMTNLNLEVTFIQLKNIDGYIEIEYAVSGLSKDIILFIKKLCDTDFFLNMNMVNIQSYSSSKNVSCNLKFSTGIKVTNDLSFLTDINESISSINENDIAKIFINKNIQPMKLSTSKEEKNTIKTKEDVKSTGENTKIKQKEHPFVYIGEGKDSALGSYIFFKNKNNNKIIKIKLVEAGSSEGDFCTVTNLGYEVHINNEIYEVFK